MTLSRSDPTYILADNTPIKNLLAKGISKTQIAQILGVQRGTLRRFIERIML